MNSAPKKRIVCFGDSNTWGYDGATGQRFEDEIRWTGAMAKLLGEGYTVIEEGLNGRTTVWEDPVEQYKNGLTYLLPCMESHSPIDLLIIMLGTNDLKQRFNCTVHNIARSAVNLIRAAKFSTCGRNGAAPKVLLVSPIHVGENIYDGEMGDIFGEGVIEKSKQFAKYYKRVSDEEGCFFLDASLHALPCAEDAIHIDAKNHALLAQAMADSVRSILG